MTRLGFYIIHNDRYKLVKTVNIPWDFTIGGPDSDNPVVDKPNIGEWDPMKYLLQPDNIAYEDEFQIVVKNTLQLEPSEQKETIKLYRVTYNEFGIFDAVKKYMTPEEWENFLNDENVNWLPKPEYEDSWISYFTEKGYVQFKEKTLPLILNIFQEENITTEEFETAREAVEEPPVEGEGEDIEIQNEEEQPPETKVTFEEWITDYFDNVLFKEKGFFDVFNTYRTYIIIAEENPSVMGRLMVRKGATYVNFREHDYRNIVNALYPDIRKDMITPDDSFGGYDDDSQFQQDKDKHDCSFGGHDGDEGFLIDEENKGIDTYPNLF